MFFIEGILEEEILDYNEKDSSEEEKENSENNSLQAISLNALTGKSTLNTMKILGRICGQQVTVPIDSGSSHNLLDVKLLQKLKLKPQLVQD